MQKSYDFSLSFSCFAACCPWDGMGSGLFYLGKKRLVLLLVFFIKKAATNGVAGGKRWCRKMNGKTILAFLQEHWYFVTLACWVLILMGAICNWNWLCDPAGKPHGNGFTRGGRRVLFFLLGGLLIVVSILSVKK